MPKNRNNTPFTEGNEEISRTDLIIWSVLFGQNDLVSKKLDQFTSELHDNEAYHIHY